MIRETWKKRKKDLIRACAVGLLTYLAGDALLEGRYYLGTGYLIMTILSVWTNNFGSETKNNRTYKIACGLGVLLAFLLMGAESWLGAT